ncbi:hypothetical protein R3P38DRAFT_2756382 [Favolaschia claudopus]|uniref:Uncharacterized protein n=1 Tax=Favolaschia claudopus TaxID=2862362 RepID=A0AAW0EF54_9AGAR
MSLPSPPPVGRRPLFPTARIKFKRFRTLSSPIVKVKPRPRTLFPPKSVALDIALLSIHVLAESADAFPPLKSVVGGVRALCDIAQRAKAYKSEAISIALRAENILNTIADAVPDPTVIPPAMLQSIECFRLLLGDIRARMERVAQTTRIASVLYLARHEEAIKHIQAQLNDAYQDFMAAATLRIEARQEHLANRFAAHHDTMVQRHHDTHVAVTAIDTELAARHDTMVKRHHDTHVAVTAIDTELVQILFKAGCSEAHRVTDSPFLSALSFFGLAASSGGD